MNLLFENVQLAFQKHYGAKPTHCFRAPGRVNLIGEHTDYNDGFVLPAAINYQTVIAATPREDARISALAVNFGAQCNTFSLAEQITPDDAAPWSNYVRGVAWALQQRGYRPGGANLAIAGNVPQGAGLSSSAALEVATATALSHLYGLELDGKTIARVGQQAENDFVGVKCGIMDQFVSALGQKDHALLLDCRSLEYTSAPIPAGVAILIANSNVKRGLVESEYNTRRRECEAAAAHFDVPALRDVLPDQLARRQHELPPTVARRARHVVTENIRTQAAAQALAAGDLRELGRLMAESHRSMHDDFEITVPPIDTLVEIIAAVVGEAGGARMTGGGFGGCVVAMLPEAMVPAVSAAIKQKYPAATNLIADVYICQAAAGSSPC